MNILKKISNWSTNNFENYQNENRVYDEIVGEMENLDDLLNVIATDVYMIEAVGLDEKVDMSLFQNKLIIDFKRKSLIKASLEEQKAIIKEIACLQQEYDQFLDELKNLILASNRFIEIQNSTSKINALISHHVLLEAFKPFYVEEMMQKVWTLEDLQLLRNKIAERRTILIPYLAEMESLKR